MTGTFSIKFIFQLRRQFVLCHIYSTNSTQSCYVYSTVSNTHKYLYCYSFREARKLGYTFVSIIKLQTFPRYHARHFRYRNMYQSRRVTDQSNLDQRTRPGGRGGMCFIGRSERYLAASRAVRRG